MELSNPILIVGGGASGVIAAIALQRAGISGNQIDIAEPRSRLGEGLAYQTTDPLHRLNVPTARMSAIEDQPNDFCEWSQAPAYSFMERRSFAPYLRERLGDAVTHIKEQVIDLSYVSENEVLAIFSSGRVKSYSTVILAMGHGAARIPEFLNNFPASDRIIRDVWNGDALPESKHLLCFGTGLSFIDLAMTHLSRDSNNTVTAISGSGNLPERHSQKSITPYTPTLEEVSTLEKLRHYLASAGDSWREAIDGLRPITQEMWRGFSAQEREVFLRSDGSAWSRRRHRIAPDVADQVDESIANGRLTIVQGTVRELSAGNKDVRVILEDGREFSGDYLALCIGRDYELSDPLSLTLVEEAKTNRGPLNMGLSVDVLTGRLLNSQGLPYRSIYAIGPLRSGEAFESTAIPEIRKQAFAIARLITQ